MHPSLRFAESEQLIKLYLINSLNKFQLTTINKQAALKTYKD